MMKFKNHEAEKTAQPAASGSQKCEETKMGRTSTRSGLAAAGGIVAVALLASVNKQQDMPCLLPVCC